MGRFKTKRGWCAVSGSELRLEENYLGQLKRYYDGATESLVGFILVAAMAISFMYLLVEIVRNDLELLPYLIGFFTIITVVAYSIDWIRGFTQVETIPQSEITEVKAVDGSWWTHSRFIVTYRTDGHTKKRRIRLPSRYFGYTDQEYEDAMQLFRSNGIPLTGDLSPPQNEQSPSIGDT